MQLCTSYRQRFFNLFYGHNTYSCQLKINNVVNQLSWWPITTACNFLNLDYYCEPLEALRLEAPLMTKVEAIVPTPHKYDIARSILYTDSRMVYEWFECVWFRRGKYLKSGCLLIWSLYQTVRQNIGLNPTSDCLDFVPLFRSFEVCLFS